MHLSAIAGRLGIPLDLDEVEACFTRHLYCLLDRNGPAVLAFGIDQLNFADADVFVGARAVFLDRRGTSHGTTNGGSLL